MRLADRMNRANILAINALGGNSKRSGPRQNFARGRLRKMRVFVVHIIFANVNHRQIPQSRKIHHFVEQPLAECAFSEETNGHLLRPAILCGKCRARRDSSAASHDGICAQIAARRVGNVHRSAFAFAVARFFSQEFGEHAVR